jgi:hypothetical protein
MVYIAETVPAGEKRMINDTKKRPPDYISPSRMAAKLRHQRAMLKAFDRIEAARQAIHDAQRELFALIRNDPEGEWQDRFDKFLAAGGVMVDELARWMINGKRIRAVKRRKHLRLVGQ